ncbi:MGMT family protein [Leptospira sp. 2 VSF19]|uniref:MGMT family protein n=1 Tax=Leptospira soteropolitanensis TaxID=2950025 RepID=A0AAW5VK00_9LEPT|nr:MGMT family protein [Leptospira soteropolitanensis]MCW7494032.1 MGMT family protein [Leptospira soteropolitanensis]MCW7501702.1 MGMT family protein [Leptospira soteropolitanensis]MCW7523878.1 MGMT family protein [Leptospira soteropolitanensis]MCW7527743.1 MGMT family protein [Leptospira soteropolitanensis]MCW7531672.1 MGMT family protein [Leptospira soteropolitanensis]
MSKAKTKSTNFYESVYAIVKKIPKGKVTTYGHIALLLGNPRAARAVGYALNALKKEVEQKIPWQRVINAQGQISFRGDTFRATLQKKILQSEGVVFDLNEDRLNFDKYGWFP